MNLRTQFEKFHNRFYFTSEYGSYLLNKGSDYLIDLIAKIIDRFFPKAHLYESRLKTRESYIVKSVTDIANVTFVPVLRGSIFVLVGMPILTIIHFVLCVVGHYINDMSIVPDGVVVGIFISFFLAFLIDYFCSFRHNKYERYREEYLKESTSKKVMWVILFPLFILIEIFSCGYFFAAANSDKVADYIVSLIK